MDIAGAFVIFHRSVCLDVQREIPLKSRSPACFNLDFFQVLSRYHDHAIPPLAIAFLILVLMGALKNYIAVMINTDELTLKISVICHFDQDWLVEESLGDVLSSLC
jgi:hypothetical protein